MSLSGRATGRALLPDEDIEKDYEDRALHEQAPETRLRRAHRESRNEVFETVHALSKKGLTCSYIARRTGFGRRSIAKWLTFETPSERRTSVLQPTSPLYFEAFLARCRKDGNRPGRHLFYDIKRRGYTGRFSKLERLLTTWRRAEKPELIKDGSDTARAWIGLPDRPNDNVPVRDPQTGHLISPIVAAALCVKPSGALTSTRRGK